MVFQNRGKRSFPVFIPSKSKMTSNRGPEVSITSTTEAGGVVKHTLYRVEVSFAGQSWVIWRRYKQFAGLNDALTEAVSIGGDDNDKEVFFNQVANSLPPKTIPSGKDVVAARVVSLHTYLCNLLQFRPSVTIKPKVEKSLNEFYDFANKGASGLAVAFPQEEKAILRENFLRIRLTNSLFYGNYYVGLSKDKVLYVCKKIYDSPRDATLVIYMDKQGGRLQPSFQGQTVVSLKNGDDIDINFEFDNKADAASWFGALGAACVGDVIERISPEKRREQHAANENKKMEAQRAAKEASRGPTQNITLGTVGNTVDAMSSEYGV
jgi:hypothetical protein